MEEELQHPPETSTKAAHIPDFQYSIDDDKEYNSDEVLDIGRIAYNEAVVRCMKLIDMDHPGKHMIEFRRSMHKTLGKALI